jgi:hypothetical protein
MEKHKGSCLCLYFILFVESHLLYVHITCSPVHTSFHSCSLYFVCSHIQTNRIDGKNYGVLTASVEQEIKRYMLSYCIVLYFIYCLYMCSPSLLYVYVV